MKLTNDNVFVDYFLGVIPNGKFMVKIYCKDMKIGIELFEQILSDQEDAEKYGILNENDYINVTENALKVLREEYEELEVELKKMTDFAMTLEFERDDLKEIVENFKKELSANEGFFCTECGYGERRLKELLAPKEKK